MSVSEPGHTVAAMHHPWRRLRAEPDVRVIFVELPDGILAFCDHEKQTIWIDSRCSQRQRRHLAAHEHLHLKRGPVSGHWESKEETAVEIQVARTLIKIDDLCTALRWSRDLEEVAWELWVPSELLAVRWMHLHPSERAALRRVLDDVEELIAP